MGQDFINELYKTFDEMSFKKVNYQNLDYLVESVREIFDRYKLVIKPTIENYTKFNKDRNIIVYLKDNGKVVEDLNELYLEKE